MCLLETVGRSAEQPLESLDYTYAAVVAPGSADRNGRYGALIDNPLQ